MMSMLRSLRLKAAGDTYLTNKRINLLDKILLLLQKKPFWYLGCFRGDSNKTLQKHCEMMEV